MPTLNRIGNEAVVKHDKEVPFRLLEPMPELSCGPGPSSTPWSAPLLAALFSVAASGAKLRRGYEQYLAGRVQ